MQEGDGSAPGDKPVLASWDEDLTAPLEVVPKGSSTVELFHDESLRAGIERALRSKDLKVSRASGGPQSPPSAQGLLKVDQLPTPLAFRIIWRYEDPSSPGSPKEILFQSTRIRPRLTLGYGGPVPPSFSATHVDVILRPDIGAAEMTEDMTRLWDGEIVLPNQPVVWPDSKR